MVGRLCAMVLGASLLGVVSVDAGGATDPLASLKWHSRVLLVLAADATDGRLAHQRAIFTEMQSGARDRDLKLVEAIGATPQAMMLRQRFDISDNGFHAILVGKDGGDKLISDEPLGADTLFPLIDAMPMRQDEMRRRS